MNENLRELISLFNQAQLKAVKILEENFECPRPETTSDYVFRCVPLIRNKNYEAGGFRIRPHGYGMEVNVGGSTIDFDFGANGELNGFDAWRLFNFVEANKLNTILNTEDKIEDSIERAMESGDIIKSQGLNYYENS